MTTARLATQTAWVGLVFAMTVAQAQSPATAIRGSWSASAGPNQVFQGTWTAEAASSDPNAAQGSWTLVNRSNQIGAGHVVGEDGARVVRFLAGPRVDEEWSDQPTALGKLAHSG
jgi:hypothetical protein